MTNKKKIDPAVPKRVVKDTNTLYDFPCDTDITGLIAYLSTIREKYGHDAKVEIRSDDDEYGDSYWNTTSVEVRITTFRDETPQEIEKRLKKAQRDAERAVVRRVQEQLKEAEKKKKQEAEELKLYQKLQKKYRGYNIENVT